MPYLGVQPTAELASTADLSDNIITTAKINADAVTAAKIADDAINSEHYTDASIDLAHMSVNSIDSDQYVDASIDTAHIANDQITLALMAAGTDGNIISYDTSGDPVAVATGTDGQVLTSSGAGAVCAFEDASSGGFTQGTEQSTSSGTSITFSSIPAGTKMICIMLMGVSSTINHDIHIQLGDAGGIETSGYLGSCSNIAAAVCANQSNTGQFDINKFNAGDICHGTAILTLADTSNTWTYTSVVGQSAGISALTYHGGGQKPLSAELTQIKFAIAGGAFNAGTVNIMYQ